MNKYYQNNKIDWIYRNIIYRCENPKDPHYKWYGAKGIKNYLTKKDIEYLMKRDNFDVMKKPTIDRRNNKKHYTLENCRFIEQSINSTKDKEIKIIQYTLNGDFIREWKSLAEVFRKLKIPQSNICHVLKYRRLSAGSFIWRYK